MVAYGKCKCGLTPYATLGLTMGQWVAHLLLVAHWLLHQIAGNCCNVAIGNCCNVAIGNCTHHSVVQVFP